MGSFTNIVAFNAVPSSGKFTVADALVELHGWVKLSPAEAMRRALIGLGYGPELFTDTTLKEVPRVEMYGLSPRQLLISLSNWGRSINQRFWIDRMIADAPFGVAGWIIESVGTEDEVAFVRMSLGAPIIRLERIGAEARPDGRVLVEPDAKTTNDGDPADAAAAVVSLPQAWSQAASRSPSRSSPCMPGQRSSEP